MIAGELDICLRPDRRQRIGDSRGATARPEERVIVLRVPDGNHVVR